MNIIVSNATAMGKDYYSTKTSNKSFSLLRENSVKLFLVNSIIIVSSILFSQHSLFAEGTRELLVNQNQAFDTTKSVYTGTVPTTPANVIQIWDGGPSAGGIGRATGSYLTINPANQLLRLKIRACRVGEVINLGFNSAGNNLTFWRLYKQNGTNIRFDGTNGAITNLSIIGGGTETTSLLIGGSGSLGSVLDPTRDYTYRVPRDTEAAQPGRINWYSQAAVGAFPGCSTTTVVGQLGVGYPIRTYCGYVPIQYVVQPGDIGPSGFADFFIVFNGADAVNLRNNLNRQLAMLDVTVWDALVTSPTQPVVRKGRFHSAAWDVNCNGNNIPRNEFNSKVFFYSKDSVVTSLTFTRMRPWGFIISANATGTANTGINDFDRRSRIQFHGAPEYPIFLNNPYPTNAADRTCGIVPKASFGNLINQTVTGCSNDRCINLLVDRTGTVGITLFPPVGNPNAFVPRVFNNTQVIGNQNVCIPWDGLDGAGNPIIGNFTIQINYFNGLTNLPLFDVEDNPNGFFVELVAPPPSAGADPIAVFWDDRPGAGTGATNINAGFSLDGFWDNDNNPLTLPIVVGLSAFPAAPAPNQPNSTFNLIGCNPLIDKAILQSGLQSCHLWSGRGRNVTCPGNPNCAETLNTWWNANVIKSPATYVQSNVSVFADQGAVPTNPDGTGATPNATRKNICSTVNPIPLTAVVKIDLSLTSVPDAIDLTDDINGTGRWSLVAGNATGSFGSAPTNLTNTYIPNAADYTRGFVKLLVVSDSTSQTPCGRGRDTLTINLFQGPDVWVRTNATVCSGTTLVNLDPGLVGDSSGVNSVVTGFSWTPFSGGVPLVGGTFVPNNQSLGTTATYTAPVGYTGTITMRLRSTATNLLPTVTCPADSAQFTFTVNPPPTVNAGVNIIACNTGVSSIATIPANHASTTATAGATLLWLGNGTFSATNSITTAFTYTPTAAELTAGEAFIRLRVTQNTPVCNPVESIVRIEFTARPTANAGPDFTLCKNNLGTITLTGTPTNQTSVGWSVLPVGGTFSAVSSNATNYTPAAGALPNLLTFTFTANKAVGGCPAATDQAVLTLSDSATLSVGSAVTYCPENPIAQLAVNVSPGFTGQWFSNRAGTISPGGTFIPNAQDPNAQYVIGTGENTFGFGLFFVTTSGGNGCRSQNIGLGINPIEVPTISQSDISVCENIATVALNPTLGAGLFNSFTWTSLGSGQAFAPASGNSLPVNTVFTPTAADKSNGSVRVIFALQPTDLSCSPRRDTVLITFTPAPSPFAGLPRSVCNNNPTVAISGTVSPALATRAWSVAAGAGGAFLNAANLSTSFTASGTPAAGTTTTLQLTSTLAGCNPVGSQVIITYTAAPTASISTPAGSVCINNPAITLTGISSTGALHWRSSSNCASCFSDTNAIAPATTIYTPSATDLANGFVTFTINTRNNGNCISVNSATVNYTFINTPTVNLVNYTPVCNNNPAIQLNEIIGTNIIGATGGTWSSSSGCAICFSSLTALNGIYTPNATDINNGSVTLTLTTTGNTSNCLAVQGSRIIIINPAPTIDAGADMTVCSNQNSVALSGASGTNITSASWSVQTGTGSISNQPPFTSAVYNITAQDKINGTAILLLSANGNAGCAPVTQQRVLLFTNIPTANAGPDRTICQNDANPATLDGSGSTGGSWSCAGCAAGITNPTFLNATYIPGAGDINQTRVFTYAVPAAAGCPSVSDQVAIRFNPSPTVTIGGPYTLCGNLATVNLLGSFTNATGVAWTSDGTGSFGNQLNAATTYTPSAADTSGTGVVNLTLTTTGGNPCSNVPATTTLTISKPILLSAGANQNQCGALGFIVNLNGSLAGPATFNSWSIVGPATGTLNNPTSLTGATYTVGAGDAGTTITFQAITNPSAPCLAQTSTVTHTFIVAPVSTAAAAATGLCQNSSITLNGTLTNVNTGTWTCVDCASLGTFSPNNVYNALIPQTSVNFTPAPADTNKASLTFRLVSDNSNVCGVDTSNSVVVTLEKQPRVNAGPNRVLCENRNIHTLAASMTNSASGVWRSGINKLTGFSPSNAFPAAITYDPDTAEVQNGFVTLTLFTTGSTFCPPDSAKVTLTFSPAPIVNAGLDRTICKNSPTLSLTGTVNPAAGFTTAWSSQLCGAACFSAPGALTTNYTANAVDTTGNASVRLFLTATDPTNLCAPVRDTLVLNMTQPPTVTISSAFPTPICSDSLYVDLLGVISSGGYTWSTNGTGLFQASRFIANPLYAFTAADRARANLAAPNNRVKLYLSSDAGLCAPVRDSIEITLAPSPIINVTTGNSITICANQTTVNLAATVNQAGYTIDWTTSGAGTYSIDPTTSGQSTTYTISPIDIAAQTIILVANTINPPGSFCRRVFDQFTLNITPLPVVNAGADNAICETTTMVSLADANSANVSRSAWSTSGTGVFGIDTSTVGVGSIYYPSFLNLPVNTNDVKQPFVTLTLTAYGCDTLTDTRRITFTPRPTLEAGTYNPVCNEAASIALSGTFTNAASVSWRRVGAVSNFAATANANYTITAANRTAGFVDLVFRANGNGACTQERDTVRITILPQATINIGPNASLCSVSAAENLEYNFPPITLTNGITPTWSALPNLDIFNPLAPRYSISATDITNGSVNITATTRSAPGCQAVSSSMTINISRAPTLNIGQDIQICANSGTPIQLNSSFTLATGVPSWSSDRLGFFTPANGVNPTYQPTATEENVGNVTTIYATISGQGSCPPAIDSLKINYTASPVLADLADTVICYTSGVPIVYNVTSGITGDWTSSDGSGAFTTPGQNGVQGVEFTTSTTSNFLITFTPFSGCYLGASVDAAITMVEAPNVTVTSPVNVCINNIGAGIPLNASPNNNGVVTWSTVQGFGSIAAVNSAITTYVPNPDNADFNLSTILAKITVQGTNPACTPAEDTVTIITHRAPTVSSLDQLVCSDLLNDANAVVLNGTVSDGVSPILWTGTNMAITTPTSISTTATVTSFPATATIEVTGLDASCAPVQTSITITAQPAPTFAALGVDIQGCSNGNAVNLNLANLTPLVNGAPNTTDGLWSTLGSGTFSPNNSGSTNIVYNPSPADLTPPSPSINLVYSITNVGVCFKTYTDTINVIFNTPVNINAAVPVQTFCAQDNNVSLSAVTSPSPFAVGPNILWSIASGVGNLTQSPAPGALLASYDPNPSNIPNGGDVANGGAVLKVVISNVIGCPNDSAFISLILVPEPAAIVNAGVTLTTCKDNEFVTLQGLVINADGGIWRTSKYGNITVPAVAASGTFSDSLDLESRYFFSTNDTTRSSIRLYLYSRGGNALCNQVVDSVDINFIELPRPLAATTEKNVCADIAFINLTGGFTAGGINGVWSTLGDGYFANTSAFDPSPVYVPGTNDITTGKVRFFYSNNNYFDCGAYSAIDSTTINPRIMVNAGPDKTVCANNSVGIPVNATLTPLPPTTLGVWTVNGTSGVDYDGSFTIDATGLNLVYTPGPALDPTNGAVSLKFRAIDNSGAVAPSACRPDSAQMILSIAPAPSVTIATNQQFVCNDINSINVNVTDINVATQGVWTSTGTGSFSNPSALNASYNFSANDLNLPTLQIAFVTTDNISNGSQCNPAGDAVTITLTPRPTVQALASNTCVTSTGITLDNSSVTYATPGAFGIWSTNSTGIPGEFTLDEFISNGATQTSYFPSASDVANGTVTLSLRSAGAGTCLPVSRTVTLNVSVTPIADAGADQFVCQGAAARLVANPRPNLVGYSWQDITTPGAVTSGIEVNPIINNTVNYELIVTDNKGCSNRDTLTVNAAINPLFTQADEACYDFYGYVRVTGQTNPVSPLGSYQWFFNNVLMNSETSDSVRVTQPGNYQVFYTLGSCTNASDKATLILDLPRILSPNFVGCENASVSATVNEIPSTSLTSYPGGSLMPFSYSWTPGAVVGNPATLATSPTSIDTLTYYVTSSYTANFVTCTYDDSVDVISVPVPNPRLVDSAQACAGGSVTLDANTPPSNVPSLAVFNPTFTWYEASDATRASLSTVPTLTMNASGSYVVEVTVGQCIGDDTTVFTLRDFPTKILPNEVKQCFEIEQTGSVILDAGPGAIGTNGLTGITYQWSSGNGDPALNTSTSQTTTITYDMIRDQTDEEITAFLLISNQYGALTCPVSDTVVVKDACTPRLFPPTAFTPGRTGGNDIDNFFTIKGKYFTNFTITVYNRWGEVIFYTEDPNTSWDGTYRGELMPVGVYPYIMTYEGKDVENKGPFKKEGRLVLVR